MKNCNEISIFCFEQMGRLGFKIPLLHLTKTAQQHTTLGYVSLESLVDLWI